MSDIRCVSGIDILSLDSNNDTAFIMFSKDNCKFCEQCYGDFMNSGALNVDIYHKICNVSNQQELNNYLKENQTLLQRRDVITYPTFISYQKKSDGLYYLHSEYNGDRTKESFSSFVKQVNSKDIRISNKIDNIFPLKGESSSVIYDLYKKAKGCFWDVSELDLSKDKMEWDTKLSKDERFFLENILAFFAQSDQIVNINLEERFQEDVDTLPSDLCIYVKLFYNFQKMMEDIHSITYETLMDTYITDKNRLSTLKNAISTIPAIKKKAEWANKWIDSENASFGTRLIAFAILEGVFFSGSFCAIFWIREKGILQGLTKSNEFISRDEGMHYNFALTLYNILNARGDYEIKCDNETIVEILKEAVNVEKEFITSSFNCRLIGMNSEEMKTYIEYVADVMLSNLGIDKVYNSNNPFLFMENIGLMNKTNFFEQRVSDYKKSNSGANASTKLSLNDFF